VTTSISGTQDSIWARRLGWTLAVAVFGSGAITLGFVFFPVRFGAPEWEISAVLQGAMTAPLAVIGWAMMLWLGLTGERRTWAVRVGGILGVLAAVVALMGALLMVLDAPVVWSLVPAAGSSQEGFPLKGAVIKAMALSVVMAVSLLGSSWVVLRADLS
jgi:hypothetical protein